MSKIEDTINELDEETKRKLVNIISNINKYEEMYIDINNLIFYLYSDYIDQTKLSEIMEETDKLLDTYELKFGVKLLIYNNLADIYIRDLIDELQSANVEDILPIDNETNR